MRPHRVLLVLGFAPLFAGVAVACHATDPARTGGQPVVAPVAWVDLPPPTAPSPAASTSTDAMRDASPTQPPETSIDEELDMSTPSPGARRDPCRPRCAGDTICWIYEHRPWSVAHSLTMPADGGWPAELLNRTPDTRVFQREAHCLPESARCPAGANGKNSREVTVDGALEKWNTCTWFDVR